MRVLACASAYPVLMSVRRFVLIVWLGRVLYGNMWKSDVSPDSRFLFGLMVAATSTSPCTLPYPRTVRFKSPQQKLARRGPNLAEPS